MGSCCVTLKGAELRLNKYSDSPVPGSATESCFEGSSLKYLQNPPEGSLQVRAAECQGSKSLNPLVREKLHIQIHCQTVPLFLKVTLFD